jgi:hypothetical protein
MKHNQLTSVGLLALCVMLMASCAKRVDVKPVCGTMEKPLVADSLMNDSTRLLVDSIAIDLYDVQQAMLPRLGYTTEGEDITLYVDGEAVATVTNTIADMGGFDDNAIWIGEKMSLDNSDGSWRVRVVPGVKFVVGLALHYENMPTLTASVAVGEDGGCDLSDVKVEN